MPCTRPTLHAELRLREGMANVTRRHFWSSPTFRVRHMALKLETPVVDLLGGQYWALFSGASAFAPATVQIQGVPGQVFSRAAQFRLSKTI